MKINVTEGLKSQPTDSKTQKIKSNPSKDFRSYLKEAATPSASVKNTDAIQQLPELSAVNGIQFISPENNQGFLDQLSQTLDLLEVYTQDLENPQKSLKEIRPNLLNLLRETEGLKENFENSTTSDPTLKRLLDDLLVKAHVEKFKMDRGDYLEEA